MAKKKYYAVKGTLTPTIIESWPECERRVRGVKGALFKGFGSRPEAVAWLGMECATEEARPDEVLIYVDGSFSPTTSEYSGWGFVVVREGQEVHAASGRTPQPALSRNIDGELEATVQAVEWCHARGQKAVICHDYEGVGRWALGEWKANSRVARDYQVRIAGKLSGIRFCKVTAHTGNRWNERADALAKSAIGLV